MSELPRGLTLSSYASGSSTAIVTFPAAPNVIWVLSAIDAIAVNGSTAGFVAWTITTNITGMGTIGAVSADVSVAAQRSPKDEWTWSGEIPQLMNAALIVQFSGAAIASTQQILLVTAFPI